MIARVLRWFYKRYPHHCRTTFEQFHHTPPSDWTCGLCGEPIEWPRRPGESE